MAYVRMVENGVSTWLDSDAAIGASITRGGIPYRPSGAPYVLSEPFGSGGGYLFDGCPLNIILGKGWIAGQLEALKEMGITCALPSSTPVSVAAGPANECSASICGPAAGPAGPTASPPNFGAGTGPTVTVNPTYIPGTPLFGGPSGKLPGEGITPSNLAGGGASPAPTGEQTKTGGPKVGTGFDIMAFIKGPMGILSGILLIIVALLSRSGRRAG